VLLLNEKRRKDNYIKYLPIRLMQRVFTMKSFLQMKYINRNPVSGKWKLVIDYRDYEHSSASFYQTGVVRQNEHFDYRLL